MNALKLNSREEIKILEMFNNTSKIYKSTEITHSGLICYSKDGKFPCKAIHWLAFCVMHLMPYLNIKDYANSKWNFSNKSLYINNIYKEYSNH